MTKYISFERYIQQIVKEVRAEAEAKVENKETKEKKKLKRLPKVIWNIIKEYLEKDINGEELETAIGDYGLIYALYKNETYDWDKILFGCCSGGYFNFAKIAIKQGANCWKSGLSIACSENRVKLVKLMVFHWFIREIKETLKNYEKIISTRGEEQQRLAVKLNKWKKKHKWMLFIKKNIKRACFLGHLEIAKFLIEEAIGGHEFDHTDNLKLACQGGHLELLKFLVEKGADNFGEGLVIACAGDYKETAEFMIEKGARNFDEALRMACYEGHIYMIKFMIGKGAKDLRRGILEACRGGYIWVVKFLIKESKEKGVENICDWNKGLYNSCQIGHLKLVKLMIKNGARDWNYGLLGTLERYAGVFRRFGIEELSDSSEKIRDLLIGKGANMTLISHILSQRHQFLPI